MLARTDARILSKILALASLALAPAVAQIRCADVTSSTSLLANTPAMVAIGDLNGDGVADLAATLPSSNLFVLSFAQATGALGPPSSNGSGGSSPSSLVLADLDGDADLDLAITNGASPANVSIFRNAGNGTFAFVSSISTPINARSLVAADLDGDGDRDLACCANGTLLVLLNSGTGAFGAPATYPLGAGNSFVAAGDVDGDLDVDLVASTPVNGLIAFVNQGGASFVAAPAVPTAALDMLVLADLDGDGDLDVVGPQTSSNVVAISTNAGGTFGAPSTIPMGAGTLPTCVAPCDVDLDGDLDLYVGKSAGASTLDVLVNAGAGAFLAPQPSNAGVGFVLWLACGDLEGDGDGDLAIAPVQRMLHLERNCAHSGDAFCAGDGTATACPCGNASALGANAGCLSSIGQGGTLRASGSARIASDALVLAGAHMPAVANAIYLQGDAREAGGLGSVLGDGLLCVGGSLVRLGTTTNSGGASSFPLPGGPSVSVRGAVAAPGERFYQAWYRNSASFCTPATSNLTNGWRVVWAP